MTSQPEHDAEETELLSPEEFQYAAIEAKLREWGLPYSIDTEFPLDRLEFREKTQAREQGHIAPSARVEEYAQQMRNGAVFPPIIIRRPNVLVDGNTRRAAAKRVHRKTFPAIIVDTKTDDVAKILAASLNQMGGERLTPGEAHEAAELMFAQRYPDSAIARELGRDMSQVRRWRNQRAVLERAEALGIGDKLATVPRTAVEPLAAVHLDRPFAALLDLFAAVRPKTAEVKEYIGEVQAQPSEDAQVAKVAELREELAPVGPPPGGAARKNIRRARMVAGNILGLRGQAETVFDPAKHDEELARWREVAEVVEEILAALQVSGQQGTVIGD